MSFYRCPVCKVKLFNTPYYNTFHGKVCEDCYESRKGKQSDYEKLKQKR
jgi:hypothetical protein